MPQFSFHFHIYRPTKTTRISCVHHIQLQNLLTGIARSGFGIYPLTLLRYTKNVRQFSQHSFFAFSSFVSCISSSNIHLDAKKKKNNKKIKFNLMTLGFNGQNFQVPSKTLNRVVTVFCTRNIYYYSCKLKKKLS